MPLDMSATQTTATKSATYFANRRLRVFGIGTLPRCCAISLGAGEPFKANRRAMKPRVVIFATASGSLAMRPLRHAVPSLDDLIGERDQGCRHLEAEHPSCFEIDSQLELRGCLRRQIAWVGTSQDSVNVRRRAVKNSSGLWSVSDQGPFAGELPVCENRGKTMLRCRTDDQTAMYHHISVRRDQQATTRVFSEFRHCLFDFGLGAYRSCLDLQRGGRRNGFKRTQEDIVVRRSRRIKHDRESINTRRELPEQLQRLPNHGIFEKAETGD